MGRYAQQRRRGSAGPVLAGPSPPPAPFFEVPSLDLILEPSGDDDTGGTFNIYRGPTLEGPWTLFVSTPWEVGYDVGSTEDLDGFAYQAEEVGNGTTYVGTSPRSETFDLT